MFVRMKPVNDVILDLFEIFFLGGFLQDCTGTIIYEAIHLGVQPQQILQGSQGNLIVLRFMHRWHVEDAATIRVANDEPSIAMLAYCQRCFPRSSCSFVGGCMAFPSNLPMSIPNQSFEWLSGFHAWKENGRMTESMIDGDRLIGDLILNFDGHVQAHFLTFSKCKHVEEGIFMYLSKPVRNNRHFISKYGIVCMRCCHCRYVTTVQQLLMILEIPEGETTLATHKQNFMY